MFPIPTPSPLRPGPAPRPGTRRAMDRRRHPGCRGHEQPLTACGGDDANPTLVSKPLAEACAACASAALPHGAKVTRTELRKADATLPDACIVRGQIVSSPESTIHGRWSCPRWRSGTARR